MTVSCSRCEGFQTELNVLCSFICVCNSSPIKSGKQQNALKQSCVTNGIDWFHKSGQGEHILAEVGYFMRTIPPMPLLKNQELGKPPEHIRAVWHRINKVKSLLKDEGEEYTKGDLRIPDVVITHNSQLPATQDNIKQVVEIKFPGDRWRAGQKKAYEDVAGRDEFGKPKLTELSPDKCGCGKDKGEQVAEPIAELSTEWVRELDQMNTSLFEEIVIGTGLTLLTGVLLADDIAGIGTADDVLIPITSTRAAVAGSRIWAKLFAPAVKAPPIFRPAMAMY